MVFYSLTPLGLRPKDIEILDNGTIGLVSALFVVVPSSWVGKGEGVWMVSSEGTIFGDHTSSRCMVILRDFPGYSAMFGLVI